MSAGKDADVEKSMAPAIGEAHGKVRVARKAVLGTCPVEVVRTHVKPARGAYAPLRCSYPPPPGYSALEASGFPASPGALVRRRRPRH